MLLIADVALFGQKKSTFAGRLPTELARKLGTFPSTPPRVVAMAEKLVVYALPASEYVASLLTGLHSRGIKHAVSLVEMDRKKRKLPSGGFKVPEITYENPARGACRLFFFPILNQMLSRLIPPPPAVCRAPPSRHQ